jgi:SAM-dependent methyltransferase
MIQFEEFTITKLEDFKSKTKFDVVILNTVLEHTESNCKCFGVLKDLLKEDGVILSYQPSNLHPFSILNRLFSHGFKLKVLKILRPWAEVGEITGWRSYYDNCNIMGFKKLCRRFNLSITDACFNYNGSDYFTFFPPLFVVIVIYEEFVKLLGLPILCSTFFVEIRHDTK